IFSDVIAFVPLDTDRTPVRYGAEPETAWVDMVTGNFFSGLGVRITRGRAFTLDDEVQHAQTAVLRYGFWTSRFGSNAAVVGDTLFIKGLPFTIVGIAAPEFAGVEHNNATDVWIPIQNRPELKPWGRPAESEQGFYSAPTWWFLMTIGRLAPQTTEAQAVARAQPIFQRAAYSTSPPRANEQPPTLSFTPARGIQGLRSQYEQPLRILMAMVIVVLTIACGNVA